MHIPKYLPGESVVIKAGDKAKCGFVLLRGNNSNELLVQWEDGTDAWTTDEEIFFGNHKGVKD